MTLLPAGGRANLNFVADPVSAVWAALTLHTSDLTAWQRADGPANVVLFIPLGLSLALLLRRPVVATALGAFTSAAVESYQAATGSRVATSADVVANAIGSLTGATVAALILLVVGTLTRLSRLDARRRGVERPCARSTT